MITIVEHAAPPTASAYGLLMIGAIGLGAWRWYRRTRQEPELLVILVGALAGGFLGAKLAYLLAEGWLDWPQPDRWLRLATGKSVLGGLLGAYAGVELIKRAHGIRTPTGDGFAATLPFGLFLGRLGCILHGCCLGRPMSDAFFTVCDTGGRARWPAPHVEAGFQLIMFAALMTLRGRGVLKDRLFFLYLTAYGAFRFAHEFLRDTPRVIGPFSAYHFLALLTCATGVIAWRQRNRAGD